jgi:hypothetical protein
MTKKYLFWLINISLSAIFISCEDSEGELELDPLSTPVKTKGIDSFSIKLSTVFESKLITSSVTNELSVGSYKDEQLGIPSAKTYFQVAPIKEYTIARDPICDSVLLVLDYRSTTISTSSGTTYQTFQLYGDSTKPMNFEVYEVNEEFTEDATYYTISTLGTEPTKLGQTGKEMIHQPGTLDTLSIELENSFGQKIIEQLAESNDSESFKKVIKGLHVTPDADADGSVIGFSANSIKTYLKVYYHDKETESAIIECAIGNDELRFNNIKANLSTSLISGLSKDGQIISADQTDQKSFLQTSTGVRTYLEIEGLRDFVVQNSKILVNSMNLKLNVAPSSLENEESFIRTTPPAISLLEVEDNDGSGVLIKRGDNDEKVNVPNQESGNNPFYVYDDISKTYNLELSLYFQDYIKKVRNGATDEFRLIVSPYAEGTHVDRAVLTDGLSVENPSKVTIYYSSIEN